MLVHRKITQKDKHKIRNSADFKKLKQRLVQKYGNIDFITGQELVEGKMTCHHMDLDPDEYMNYTNEDNFMLLNENTHRLLHQLYNFYEKDQAILKKFERPLERMLELNARR